MAGSESLLGPVLGPCTAWISGADVAACCQTEDAGSDTSSLDEVAASASMILYELSARQFAGECSKTVRPCRNACGCWHAGIPVAPSLSKGEEECGDCCSLSTIPLDGYPVTSITEVLIDGAAVDPDEYRLDDWRNLVRLADPGPPVESRSWPSCQNLALDSDQPGTFEITYTFGVDPPQIGKDAAAALACELWKACPGNAGKCNLPGRVTKIVRQGVTYERVAPLAALLREGATGIPALDIFIGVYNPNGLRRRAAIWSPDLQEYPRKVGP